MSKDAYWFSHDSNAQDDPKCMVLIDQLGMEGFGIFWALIEKLRCEKDYRLPLIVASSFGKRWGTSKEKVEAVIKNYGLFCIEDEYFFSLRLQRSMTIKSEKARISANIRWNKDANAMRPHSKRNANGMLNDAIKGKEKKEKNTNVFVAPSVDEVEKYFEENGYSKEAAKKAHEHYQIADWHDTTGKPVKNWKQKMNTNWFKPENLMPSNNSSPRKITMVI